MSHGATQGQPLSVTLHLPLQASGSRGGISVAARGDSSGAVIDDVDQDVAAAARTRSAATARWKWQRHPQTWFFGSSHGAPQGQSLSVTAHRPLHGWKGNFGGAAGQSDLRPTSCIEPSITATVASKQASLAESIVL